MKVFIVLFSILLDIALASDILSDPGTLGPTLEIVHLFYDQWPTGE